MSYLQRLWGQVSPTLESIELGSAPDATPPAPQIVAEKAPIRDDPPAHLQTAETADAARSPDRSRPQRSVAAQWFFNDVLYVAMLLLALAGVIFRLPVTYWIFLTPVFGLISIVEGWSHFATRTERLGLAYRVAAIWAALLVAIYLLYNSGVEGVLNANGTQLAMITLLALGTFVAGVQARVWQICAVGGILFVSVPGVGWLDQSPFLLSSATVVVIAIGGLIWWFRQSQLSPVVVAPSAAAEISRPE